MATTLAPRSDAKLRGIVYMVLATLAIGMMSALVKMLAAEYSVLEILFFRSLLAIIPVVILAVPARGLHGLRTTRLVSHFIRGAVGVASLLLIFLAYAVMPIADVTAITFSQPLFVTALSIPLLGEKVGSHRWGAVLVGLAGVLLIIRPGLGAFDVAAVYAVAGSFLWAVSMIICRRLTTTESSAAIVLYFLIITIAITGVCLPFVWVTPSLADAALLVGLGLISGFGQFCSTQAYRFAPAAVVAPFYYLTLIWTIAFGYWLWADTPDWNVAVGGAVIIASGLYVLFSETGKRARRLKGLEADL